MLFIILGAVCLIIAAIIGGDMLRFHVAQKRAADPKALGTPAGGTLFIQGGKTYYQMPKGARRLIAEYAMDLRPESPDMVRFKGIMQKAADEHAREVAESKAKADAAMHAVAKEASK